MLLTDDAGMLPLHAAHLDRPRTTDVISFAYPPAGGERGWRGDVVVNVQRALQEGAPRRAAARELALYLAHGCHHLSGADDSTPPQRRAMLRTEQSWLRHAAAAGRLAGILQEKA